MSRSFSLVLCREDPISVFQLVKACVIITGIVIRIIVSLVKYCNKDAIRAHHHVKYKVGIMIGILVRVLASGGHLKLLTQTEHDSSGTLRYRLPTTIIDDQFNDQRYFANVSIFASYNNYFDVNKLDPDKSDSVVTTGLLKMAVWEQLVTATVHWTLVACYTVDSQSATIQSVTITTCAASGYFTNPSNLFIKFRYDEPGLFLKKNILGDIYVNMKLNQSGQCSPFNDYRGAIEDSLRDQVNMTLHYYRTDLCVNDTDYMKHNGAEPPGFFRNTEPDMTDVQTAWKTGWRQQCEAKGHTAPVLDTGMELDCSMADKSTAKFFMYSFKTMMTLCIFSSLHAIFIVIS
ncbi:hypothetical protein Btru_064081 [Bulinus truncatus]|nr:hypothetical protein Btru_064081 [Bulinus truncatus]